MAETVAKTAGTEAYYSTSRTLGTGTTSTITLQLWQLLNEHLLNHQSAMSGSALAEATGLTLQEIDGMFAQEYYQKHYGLRRFDSFQAWQDWALENGILYNPEIHDLPAEDETTEAEVEEDEMAKA